MTNLIASLLFVIVTCIIFKIFEHKLYVEDHGMHFLNVFSLLQLILDRVSKSINDNVNRKSAFQKAFFKFAYDYKSKWIHRGYTTPILDKYVYLFTLYF